MKFTIIVSPKRVRDKRAVPSVYDARLFGQSEILCSSNTVFLDAARCLLNGGRATPDDTLIMQHDGSKTDALRAPVGVAARLSIEERVGGPHAVRFVPWKPIVLSGTFLGNRRRRHNSPLQLETQAGPTLF
jgi:hypothetical protein